MPPRTPNAMWLPNFDKLRVDTSEDSAVYQALRYGGCKLPSTDLSVILDLRNGLTRALQFYVSECEFATDPSEFRRKVHLLRKSLADLITNYPPSGGVVEAAIADRLERDDAHHRLIGLANQDERELNESPTLFLARTSRRLNLLEGMLADLAGDESGRGRDGDRALAKLINALLVTYTDFTGRRPGIGTTSPVDPDYLNPAERFVEAVVAPLNEKLPDERKISRSAIQYRVRRWAEKNRQ